MGNCEQQCINQNQQNFIDILSIPLKQICSDYPIQAGLFTYPIRNYTKQAKSRHYKNEKNEKEQMMPLTVRFLIDLREKIQQNVTPYLYMSRQMREKTKNIQINSVLMDQLNLDKLLYKISQGQIKYSMFLRTFQSFETQEFLSIIYQIDTYIKISLLRCQYLHKIQHHYCIIRSKNIVNSISSLVTYLQPVTTNLSLIIKQRRKQNKPWMKHQYYNLICNLVEALSYLHKNNFTHNDIRPSNIFYSEQKKCFLLGSFSNVTKSHRGKLSTNIKLPNHYRDIYSSKKIQMIANNVTDLQKSDVYSLGMTLLSAFYLCQPIDKKKCAPFNRQLIEKYPHLKIIKLMIGKVDQRKNIEQIHVLLRSYPILENKLIETIHYNCQALDNQQIRSKKQSYIVEAYKQLGMIESWKQSIKKNYLSKTNSQLTLHTARVFQQLASISNLQGKYQKSAIQYVRSAEIYLRLGDIHFKERSYLNALGYYERGFKNFASIKQVQNDPKFLKLLVNLSETKAISGLDIVEPDHLNYIQALINNLANIQPFIYWQLIQKIINIYQQLEDYQKVAELLSKTMQKVQIIKTKINMNALKKQIIANNIKIANQNYTSILKKQQILKKTENIITQVKQENEYDFLQNQIEKAEMDFLHFSINFYLQQTVDNLQKIINLESQMESLSQQQQSIEQRSKFKILRSQIFVFIGDAYFYHLLHYNKSLTYYSLALQLYKQYFGGIYNIQCSALIAKIGLCHRKYDRFKTYLSCMELANKITRSIFGRHHPKNMALSTFYNDNQNESQSNSRMFSTVSITNYLSRDQILDNQ